jgi:peptidoglycan/xylan/chitin deacetylase (PgdA/CDA1 family)
MRQRLMKLPRKAFSTAVWPAVATITHVSTRAPVAALTFDDGPHREFTPRLLDILEKHRARATFFMVGEAAQQHPELVRRVALSGHTIGNHSWDHASFPLISRRERQAQIRACERAIAPHGQRFFRPPYGQQNMMSRLDALWLGYKVIAWNLDVGDWWDDDAGRMADLLETRVRPGSIILLHDALRDHPHPARRPMVTRKPHVDREAMLKAITLFLERVSHRLHFITIPELLRHGRPQRQSWYKVTRAAGGSARERPAEPT